MKNLISLLLATLLNLGIAHSQTEVTFYTSMGDFVVECYDTLQPITAGNFIDLVNAEFYDDVIFHRVIDGFMIQGGDPTGTGFGGPGYSIPDEFHDDASNVQKALGMANSGPNTGGSQFFINLVNNTYLDDNHPVFGFVIEDFSVVQDIGDVPTDANDRPITDVVMDSLRVTHVGPYVGIDEASLQAFDLSIFPNPAEDQFTVAIEHGNFWSSQFSLAIHDVFGRVLFTRILTQPISSVDISTIARNGLYTVNVTELRSKASTQKRIVVR